jgi:hypothetical protein
MVWARVPSMEGVLTFEPRIPGFSRLARGLVERIFAHRHRRLRGWFAQ